MKKLIATFKKCLILFIVIGWLATIIGYFLAQTSFGGNLLARYLTSQSPYLVTIENISHSIQKPYEITLYGVKIKDKADNKLRLESQSVVVALTSDKLFQIESLDYLIIKNGNVYIDENSTSAFGIKQANLLQFLNVDIYLKLASDNLLTLKQAYGGIKSWTADLSNDYQFNVTSKIAMLNNFNTSTNLFEGFKRNNIIYFSNIGGNVGDGFFIAKAKYLANNSWQIDELQINHINLHIPSSIQEFASAITKTWSNFSLKYLTLIDSNFTSPEIEIEKINLEARNINHFNQWDITESSIQFNAELLKWRDELFTLPALRLSSNDKILTIDRYFTHWQHGFLTGSGQWSNNHLVLEDCLIAGIRYTLPENWLTESLKLNVPDVLSNVTVKKLTIMPSDIIDINKDFPMQFSAFGAKGTDLRLVHKQQVGLWQGNLNLVAEHATINTETLRRIDLNSKITLTKEQQEPEIVSQFSAFTDTGLLDFKLQMDNSSVDWQIDGHSVVPELLKNWRLIENPPQQNLRNSSNFTLQLQGSRHPWNLSGILNVKNSVQNSQYLIKNGQVTN